MKIMKPRHVFALSALSLLASLPFVACATSEVGPALEDPVPPPGDPIPSVPPSSDAGTADASADAAADADAAPDPDARRCTESGFCLEPLPLQRPLLAVSATSMDDAWAVARDAILRWDGTSWKIVYQHAGIDGAEPELFGIRAPKRDDAWALASDALIRYSARDGGAPEFREHRGFRAKAAEIKSYWVDPASEELWIVTSSFFSPPMAYRYRETPEGALEEKPITDPEIGLPWIQNNNTLLVRSVFGFAADDIYVGGALCTQSCSSFPEWDNFEGAIAHYDGTSWSMVATLGKGETVSSIYGTKASSGPQQLWVWVGREGMTDPNNELRLLSLPEEEGGAATVVARQPIRLDHGSGHPKFDSWRQGCHYIFGSAAPPESAWMSDVCFVYRWNGTSLERMSTVANGVPLGAINGIWASDDEEAWIVGQAPRQLQSELPKGFAARRVRKAP